MTDSPFPAKLAVLLGAAICSLAACHVTPDVESVRRVTVPDPCATKTCEHHTAPRCADEPSCQDREPATSISNHSTAAATFREHGVATCPYAAPELPARELLDDSSIPQFRRSRTRYTNMYAGRGFLQDHELHRHLLGVQSQIFDCLDLAACYGAQRTITGGDLDFEFELRPTGRVGSVSVTATGELESGPVVACARKSLYETRFPEYDGASMFVSYRMTIEEVP